MDLSRLAGYAYHNCEFRDAIDLALKAPADPVLAEIHLKALGELDQKEAAVAAADRYVAAFPGVGSLHYLRGMAAYLGGRAASEIVTSFETATSLGYGGGRMGLAFIAYIRGRQQEAIEHLMSAAGQVSSEIDHVRRLMLFQVHVAAKDLPAAREDLLGADRLLSESPSLLRHFWGQLCWVRLMRALGDFDGAKTLIDRLLALVDPQRMPRLHRNGVEARRLVEARSDVQNINMPPQQVPPEITRKPMLHSVYAYLTAVGTNGASKEQIAINVWEETYNPTIHDDRIYKTIARLRKLLGDDHSTPHRLVQRGRHYVLTAPMIPESKGDP